MKKIGILTYFGDLNLGTTLQAYSTLNAVQKVFPEAHTEIVNFLPMRIWNKPFLSYISLESLINDFRRIRNYTSFLKRNFQLSHGKLITSSTQMALAYIRKQGYDIIFVGADTVLELHRVKSGELPVYWLDPSLTCKKVMIAASARSVTYCDLSVKQKQLMKESIDGFDFCGVRDESTFKLISNFVPENNSKLNFVPDPTFTLEIDHKPIEKYLKQKGLKFDINTICFHLNRKTHWANELSNKFKKSGYRIASFRPAKYADVFLNALSPLEQLGIYKYFKLVITDRFHDTIFCLKNGTPMITFPFSTGHITQFGDSKYSSLLNTFGIRETNLFDKQDQQNAEYIYENYEDAVHSFFEKESFINITQIELKEQYYSFLYKIKKELYFY